MKITETAQLELKKALDSFDNPGYGIHLFSTQGCCGPSIQMDIAAHAGSKETVISIDGIDFFVENDLIATLDGVTIEYGANGFWLAGRKKSSGCCG